MASIGIEDMIHKFSSLTDKPTKFLSVQNDVKEDIKTLVKSLYDYTKSEETGEKSMKKNALPEIIVKDFDEEQIWQQIDLQNTDHWDGFVWDVANCMSSKNELNFPIKIAQPQEDVQSKVHTEVSENDKSPQALKKNNEIKTMKKNQNNKSKVKTKTSIVDDDFFKLQEMEEFLLKEEKMESKEDKKKIIDSDDESIDMFENIDDEDSENEQGDVMYNDFFDNEIGEDKEEDSYRMEHENSDINEENLDLVEGHNTHGKKIEKRVRFVNQESDESVSEDNDTEANEIASSNGYTDTEKQTEFEKRQQRLKQQISKLEEKTLIEAPWQLKGEVDATKRPQNSLLEEVVDFDLTTRPPPIITEQTTLTLEDIIKRRIKDKAWDDVIRKEKPVEDQLVFRKSEVLDQNKSKLSLAQVYEAEYLKQKHNSGGNEDEKEPERHTEIRDLMGKLFAKLNALCHYHYTPKAPQAEVKIISNTPAISMEEVAPVATSEAALLAPEEVKKKHRGDLLSKAERTQTDKNRERRKKKKLQRKKGKIMKVTEHRNTSKGVEANDKSLKTSKAFFQQLNDDATSLIKSKNKRNVKNKGQ